jgi:hypothetical protein
MVPATEVREAAWESGLPVYDAAPSGASSWRQRFILIVPSGLDEKTLHEGMGALCVGIPTHFTSGGPDEPDLLLSG